MYASCVVCDERVVVSDVTAQIMVDAACRGHRCTVPCSSCRRAHDAAMDATIADLRAKHAASKAEACGTPSEPTPPVMIDGRVSLDRAVNSWCLGDRKDVFSIHIWNAALDFVIDHAIECANIQTLLYEIGKAKV